MVDKEGGREEARERKGRMWNRIGKQTILLIRLGSGLIETVQTKKQQRGQAGHDEKETTWLTKEKGKDNRGRTSAVKAQQSTDTRST